MGLAYSTDQPASPLDVQPAEPTPTQLQQLVAPIALYPDELVAQILAAATYPEQVVEAERWMQQRGRDNPQQLTQEVDAQAWDPSVKALTQFPSVLANMDKNLSWTSSLGDAYVNHQQDVMDAIQAMRQRAEQAGNLQTTSQQKVVEQGSQIVIQPTSPEVVYVPQYDPWVVYGAPLVAWPGWYWYPGLYLPGPGIVFGGREQTLEEVATAGLPRLPLLEELPVQTSWWGYYENSPDHNALVGRSAEPEGFFYATGFSGHGFQQAPAVGEYVAELVAGREPTLDLSAFDVARFERGSSRPESFVV